jgi:hypothetical protein
MTRIAAAWRALDREQRLAALASGGLFVSMFLPWYSKTIVVGPSGKAAQQGLRSTQQSLNAFQAFSFVEAAVLLVSAGVLTMLFARAEQRDFQLPGGDGLVAMIAGGWAALLIFYRLLDKPGLQGSQRITATVGVEWGIFIALLVALAMLYAGRRIRAGERPGPPLSRARARPARSAETDPQAVPGPEQMLGGSEPEHPAAHATLSPPAPARPASTAPVPAASVAARRRPRFPPAPGAQMSFEEDPSEALGGEGEERA